MRMNLNQSSVVFQADGHRYLLGEQPLTSVTTLLKQKIFTDMYGNIPQEILDKAAEHGTMVHEACELIDDLGVESTIPEAISYKTIRDSHPELEYVCSEYLVSDNTILAGSIDKVFKVGDNEYVLADIKNTSELKEEYVTWQTSIYAHLFELQNPHAKVVGLYAIWLKNENYKFLPLQRIPQEHIDALIEAYTNNTDFAKPNLCPIVLADDAIRQVVSMLQQRSLRDEEEKSYTEFANGFLKQMEDYGVKSFDCWGFKSTYTPPTESETFDAKRFKAEHPDLYAQYVKKTKRKASIRFTLHNDYKYIAQ
jgi:hypothetical protein